MNRYCPFRISKQSGMKIYIAFLLLIFTFGCASQQKPKADQPLPEPPKAAETQILTEASVEKKPQQSVEELQLPKFEKVVPEKPLPPPEAIDPKKVAHAEGNLSVSVENMPLSDFINYAFGSLKVTFFIDEQVKNMKDPVTMRMAGELPVATVFEMITGVLDKKGLVMEEKAGALYIFKSRPLAPKPVDVRAGRDVKDSPAEILQIVVLKHLRTFEISDLIRDLYKTGVSIRIHPRENALLLSGQASAIKGVMEFIEMFDVPYVEGKKAFILKLTYWQTDEFVKQITQILGGLGFAISGSPRDPGIIFIPVKFLNSLLVLAPDDVTAKYVLEWKEKLDTAESAGKEEKAYTYIPKYSKASDLLDALKRLYIAAPPAQAGQKTAVPETAQIIASGLKVSSDDKRNVLLILTSPAEYKSILSYLERLDVPPRQVLIEATIAELTLKDDLTYGLEWYLNNKWGDGQYTIQTLGNLGLGSTGLVSQFVSNTGQFQALLSAFAQDNKINIISSPRLMVLDNEESSIQIGTDVPVISSETKSTAPEQQTTISTQSVQYRSTGLLLKVKPTINTEGILTLNVSLESSEAQSNTLSSVNSPIILTRRINTLIAATTGQSILLGGLMSNNQSETKAKVPFLGDIPIIGNLFKKTSKGGTKTELMILLTPTIMKSTDDAVLVTNEFKQGLKWMK